MYSGLQPAITALIAIFSNRARRVVRRDRTDDLLRVARVPLSMRSTRTGVGGTTGRPSLQPREKHSSCSSSGTCSSMTRASAAARQTRLRGSPACPGSTLLEPQPGWKSGKIGAERAEPRHPGPLGAIPADGAPALGALVEAMRVGTVSTCRPPRLFDVNGRRWGPILRGMPDRPGCRRSAPRRSPRSRAAPAVRDRRWGSRAWRRR